MYGNVVTKPSYEPQRRTSAPKRKKNVSRRVSQNRKKALAMNRAYVTFLAVAAIFALILCVNYVQMQSRITSHSKEDKFLAEGACRFEGAEQYEV